MEVGFGEKFLVTPAAEAPMLVGITAPPDQEAEVVGRVTAKARVHTLLPRSLCASCPGVPLFLFKLRDGGGVNSTIFRTWKTDPDQETSVYPLTNCFT